MAVVDAVAQAEGSDVMAEIDAYEAATADALIGQQEGVFYLGVEQANSHSQDRIR